KACERFAEYNPDRQRKVQPGHAKDSESTSGTAPSQDALGYQAEPSALGNQSELQFIVVGFDGDNHVDIGLKEPPAQGRAGGAAFGIKYPLGPRQALNSAQRRLALSTRCDHNKPVLSHLLSSHPGRQLLAIRKHDDGCVNCLGAYEFEQATAPSRPEPE